MSVAVVGINHRTVPLEALEPLIVAPGHLPKALSDLCSRPHLDEVVLLSTCMRTEVYAVVNRFHGAMADIREFLAGWSGKAPEEFSGNLYSYFDEAAVSHLFRVASGLDSASLGEPEVLGQVRRAAETARREGASGPVLNGAFRHALEVGKRARTETSISRGVTSLSYAAVQLAGKSLGGWAGRRALVLGAGEVGRQAAFAFSQVLVGQPVLVANRTLARAEALAAEVGGRAVPWGHAGEALAEVDVVASATAAEATVLAPERVDKPAAGRPLLVIDLAVPRTVDASLRSSPGVTLLDLDDISAFISTQLADRRAEVPAVERIISQESARHAAAAAERGVAPLIAALHEYGENVRQGELGRFAGKSGPFGEDDLAAIDALTRRVVAKLLHGPTVRVKSAAGTARGEALADAMQELFDLEP